MSTESTRPRGSAEASSSQSNSERIYLLKVYRRDPVFATRNELPAAAVPRDHSVWSVVKNAIGRDLTKLTMPITFNEPLSFLQRLAEYMEYAHLLNEAVAAPNPIERIEKVGAFAMSTLANTRLTKPFNPLLFETYELTRPNYRFMAEQVSHHPPVSAFSCVSEHYEFFGTVAPKLKLYGRSIECDPNASFTLI
ncbi:Oxysterol-binding protein, partial [Aphelenchoides avenae]